MPIDYNKMGYKDFESTMEREFPEMYGGQYGGFEIGAGWSNIVYNLSKCINDHVNFHKKKEPDVAVTVDRVKEKFGGLRFYYTGGNQRIDGMVRLAEYMAANTCEHCGQPGEQLYDDNRWMRVRCAEHKDS